MIEGYCQTLLLTIHPFTTPVDNDMSCYHIKPYHPQEPINQYMLNKRGQVVKDVRDFHRKDFHPPSLKERHFQNKMLLSQLDATLQQRHRIEDFFGQIEADIG